MRESKDPEIKLFGKKIALPENEKVLPLTVSGEDSGYKNSGNASCGVKDSDTSVKDSKSNTGFDCDRCLEDEKASNEEKDEEIDEENQEAEKNHISGELSETKSEEKDQNQMMEDSEDPKLSSESDNNPKTPNIDEDSPALKTSKTENDPNDASNSQEKPLKKPDKILPCPRCNSIDTKFCYYNNYNVNQPRHFCKSCQRYWTAGGTMRYVPVGAGRRKNKNSAPHCRHITIPEALQAERIDPPNGFHHPTFKPNGIVLSFGPGSPLSESMASILSLSEKKVPNGIHNGFYGPENKNSFRKGGENGDDCCGGSSVTASTSMVDGGTHRHNEVVAPNVNGFAPPVPCMPGIPWPYPWNAAVPLPAICPPGYPLPLCPPPYWNCNMLGPWSIPWLTPPSPNENPKGSGSTPNSPLGKHSREGDLLNSNSPDEKEPSEEKNSERSVLVPKTLRIDDPNEAAKSSIWSTLGIKYDSVSRGGLFKALQPKSDQKDDTATTSPMLQANPAALSRSLSFQERA